LSVVKTTIYLDNDLDLTLRQIATAQRRSQTQIIRDSLVAYITQAWSRPLPPGTGEFDSGRTNLSASVEEIMRSASAGKRKWR
jgi:predicted transcriptional regulator